MFVDRNLDELEQIIGYAFKDKTLLEQAMVHRSYAAEHPEITYDNERLEFLGDAVLELVMTHILFHAYGNEYSEGDLTRMRALLVNETQLARQAEALKIGKFLRLGKGEDKSGGRQKKSILADCLEAIIGAMYLDGGLEPCFNFIEGIYQNTVKEVKDHFKMEDYKSALQELTQAKFHIVPSYRVERVFGPDHSKNFEVVIVLDDNILARGKGTSKKKAEQEAAREALKILKNEDV